MAARRKQALAEKPMKPLGSDNEWNVDYARRVVNRIWRESVRREPAAAFHLTTFQSHHYGLSLRLPRVEVAVADEFMRRHPRFDVSA